MTVSRNLPIYFWHLQLFREIVLKYDCGGTLLEKSVVSYGYVLKVISPNYQNKFKVIPLNVFPLFYSELFRIIRKSNEKM